MFAIDFKGQTNLLAQEIPSAVGMRGFYIGALKGEYYFFRYDCEKMLKEGTLRPCSWLGRSA
ncbi:hypothetical protein [Bradyrhizobium neotropicale]|uniref:hypothetical protein n=1 Tax=Bradyrhizobium neotropicale TaxID=1497615 RepID=UPI001AD7B3E1|nr:hypothetical protein [Bradyrhizobium neotropicale]MBO4228029.1 hypothetical protein [Bradyrhizobium neotropicale]